MVISNEQSAAKYFLSSRGIEDPECRLRGILVREGINATVVAAARKEAACGCEASLSAIRGCLLKYKLADELVERIIGVKRPLDGPPDSAAVPASKAARVYRPDEARTAGTHLPPALHPAANSKGASLMCLSSHLL